MFLRVVVFVLGICMLALGIATVTNAHLGTSAISSLAYVLTLKTGISMGTYVFLTNCFFYVVQLCLDRRHWWQKALMQLPTTFLFAAVIDVAMTLTQPLTANTYLGNLLMVLAGCLCIGLGISAMVFARLAILPVEGAVLAIMQRFGGSFATLRVSVDIFLVSAAVICSFAFFGSLKGVREGTLLAALLGGTLAKVFLKIWGKYFPKQSVID